MPVVPTKAILDDAFSKRYGVAAFNIANDLTLDAVMCAAETDPSQFVREMLEGLALANPVTLRRKPEHNIIYRADAPSDTRVSVIQGSGSGHEPAHLAGCPRGNPVPGVLIRARNRL